MNLKPRARSQWLALLMAACLGAGGASSPTLTLYIAPGGSDGWSGALRSVNRSHTDGPLATLEGALEKARAARRQRPGTEARIILRGGVYRLERPLVFAPEDSDLTVEAFRGETPVITSEARLTGWRRSSVNSNVWETQPPAGRRFHALSVNGVRKGRARLPVSGFFHYVGDVIKGQPTLLRVRPGDIKPAWARGGVELVALQAWAQTRNQIRGFDAASNIVTLAGNALPDNHCESDGRYYIENAPEGLRPGQWCQDEQTGVVSYWPEPGEDAPSASITAPCLGDLLHLQGEENRPVRNIVFRRLVFAGADWRWEGGSDIDYYAAVEIEAVFQARLADGCAVKDCLFTRLGGYAVEFGYGCQNNTVAGCEMFDLGAGGVKVGNDTWVTNVEAARETLNFGNFIADNHIHHIGLVSAPAAGVLVLMSARSLIAHNEIDHTFYTAISVGWSSVWSNTGWVWRPDNTPCRENVIEFNHVHDIGQGMLSDMGGIYTLGAQPGTIIRGNLIHDLSSFAYGASGLYLDEHSSCIRVESNVVYHCGIGFSPNGTNNALDNNIFALNRDCGVALDDSQGFFSFTFTNNIVYFSSGRPFDGPFATARLDVDRNIYFDTRSNPSHALPMHGGLNLDQWRAKGHDVHSVVEDPMLAAPEKGDFHLRRGSPAITFGFHPFDLREAGVRPRNANPPKE
jgi:hypothetical protein